MKKTILFIFLIATTPLFPQNLELPHYKNDSEIIQHIGYALKYNEHFEQSEWVAYQLTAKEVNEKSIKRRISLKNQNYLSRNCVCL